MARLTSVLAATLALTCSVVRGHFELTYPSPVGELNEDDESTGPCGGYTPDLETIETTDFHVGGDSIAVSTSHPQAYWLYRFTFDNNATASPAENWTQTYPIVLQEGINSFCQPDVTIPEKYIGRKAVLGVVGKASDGMLYQVCYVLSYLVIFMLISIFRSALPSNSSPVPARRPMLAPIARVLVPRLQMIPS